MIKLLNGKRLSDFRGNKDVLKLLGGDKPTALEGNGDEPKYTVAYWRKGLKEYSTYHLQAVGKKRTYDYRPGARSTEVTSHQRTWRSANAADDAEDDEARRHDPNRFVYDRPDWCEPGGPGGAGTR